MSSMMVNQNFYSMGYAAITQSRSGKSGKTEPSFSEQIEKNAAKKNYTSATEDYKKRHPESASSVDSQIRAGKSVLKKNGAENVCRDDMTMEEYKRFFTDLMNSIPYDWSQKNDVNVWSITKDGWEQMKNDPDYEAWVLGYTVQDRAVNIPFAAMPGYSPSYHTEHFGASIDEHLGQGIPMNNPAAKKMGDDEESWWEKRHEEFEKFIAEQIKEAQEKAKEQKELAWADYLNSQMVSQQRLQSVLIERVQNCT